MEDDFSFVKKEKAEQPEMDMTPMVDVTFLLLIFFMVTAAFTMQKSFEIPTPKTDHRETGSMLWLPMWTYLPSCGRATSRAASSRTTLRPIPSSRWPGVQIRGQHSGQPQ